MHEAEFDQKGQEENIWEKVLEEFGFDGDGEFVASLDSGWSGETSGENGKTF